LLLNPDSDSLKVGVCGLAKPELEVELAPELELESVDADKPGDVGEIGEVGDRPLPPFPFAFAPPLTLDPYLEVFFKELLLGGGFRSVGPGPDPDPGPGPGDGGVSAGLGGVQ
jgi:hypothetical protein